MGIFGLPITVLMNPQGREIARLLRGGPQIGASDSGQRRGIIKALIANQPKKGTS